MKSAENNTLDLLTVKRAVYSWSIRFKSAGYGNEQLAMISAEYLEDLHAEGVTLRQFGAAARMVRRRCRFFPSMAEILDAVQECRCRPELMAPVNSTAQQIPEHTATCDNWTPEELERNKERVRLIAEALAGKMSFDEAGRAVMQMGHINDFSTMETKQQRGAVQ